MPRNCLSQFLTRFVEDPRTRPEMQKKPQFSNAAIQPTATSLRVPDGSQTALQLGESEKRNSHPAPEVHRLPKACHHPRALSPPLSKAILPGWKIPIEGIGFYLNNGSQRAS